MRPTTNDRCNDLGSPCSTECMLDMYKQQLEGMYQWECLSWRIMSRYVLAKHMRTTVSDEVNLVYLEGIFIEM